MVHYQSLRTLDSALNTTKAWRLELKRLDCENRIELSEPNRCDGGAAGNNVRTARCRAEANTGEEWGRKRRHRGGGMGRTGPAESQ